MSTQIRGYVDIQIETITNDQIAADAGIVYSKLDLAGSIVDADIVSVDWSKITGTVPGDIVLTSGSYADPAWITSLAGAKIAGAVAAATLAASATVLATARAINGVNFDGSAAITVTAAAGTLTGATLAANVLASSLTSVGTLTSLILAGDLRINGNSKIKFYSNDNLNFGQIYTPNDEGASTAPLSFETGVGAVMRITNGGNVGIGTATPTHKLEVLRGNANTGTGFYGADSNAFFMTDADIALTAGGAICGITSNSTAAIDRGGTLAFGGRSLASSSVDRKFATLKGAKENSTDGNQNGYFAIGTLNHNLGATVERFRVNSAGRVGIGVSAPLSMLHLPAGSATANTAPVQFTSGSAPETTARAGVVEFVTDDLFFTITTAAARKAFVLDDGARLTSGKIPRASTNGRLIDGPTPLAGTKVYYVADASGGAVTRKLTFTDGILTAET